MNIRPCVPVTTVKTAMGVYVLSYSFKIIAAFILDRFSKYSGIVHRYAPFTADKLASFHFAVILKHRCLYLLYIVLPPRNGAVIFRHNGYYYMIIQTAFQNRKRTRHY